MRWLTIYFLLFILSISTAFAQLAQYGYVVGTLEPQKSFLEKLDQADKGKYLHYHIFVQTDTNTEYQVVIDVNDVSPTKPLTYRIASLNALNPTQLQQTFGTVLNASAGFHLISNTQASYGPIVTPTDAQRKAAGALDYIRHPGVLAAIEGLPWQTELAQTTSDPLQWSLPMLDALFKAMTSFGATKVYVFGAPFTMGGNGMHVVHQNQADTTAQYAGTNAPWQDGGIIVESHRLLPFPPAKQIVSRKLLMVRFDNQVDFSAETNDPAKPAPPGHAVTPAVQTHPLGLICGDYQTFGPLSATQLEVSTSSVTANPDGPGSAPMVEVHVKSGSFTSLADPGDISVLDRSTITAASARAFARAYSPIFFRRGWAVRSRRTNYYVRVHAIDPGSWCDSEVDATLKVTTY